MSKDQINQAAIAALMSGRNGKLPTRNSQAIAEKLVDTGLDAKTALLEAEVSQLDPIPDSTLKLFGLEVE